MRVSRDTSTNRTRARDCPWHTYGTDTGPAERWRRNGRDDRPLRLGDDAQRPLTLRGRKAELADELLDVEELGVRLVTHLKDRLTVLDPEAVHDPPEDLAAVQAACDHRRHLCAGELRLPLERRLAAYFLCGQARSVRKLQLDRLPLIRDDHVELDEVGALPRRRIHDREGAAGNLRGNLRNRALRELAADVLRLGVARQHLRRDVVRGTTADRVVRRVLEHARPRLGEKRLRPIGAAVERLQRLGVALEPPFRTGTRRLEVDAGRDDAGEQVRARGGTQLAAPTEETVRRGVREVLAERADRRSVGDTRRKVVHERLVVGPDHAQHRIAPEPGTEALLERPEIDRARHVEDVRGIAVSAGQVLRDHRGAVDPFPDEAVEVDRGRDSAPHDGRLDPGRPEDLRHLRHVPEHVGQIADAHRTAELLRAAHPRFEIAQRRLAVDEELVHQRLPRAECEAAGLDERANPLLRLRTNLDVVVHRCELTVQGEAEGLVGLEPVE